jgi:hypothetical protein
MQGAVMLQALLMAVTNNGQRSRRNGHEASTRHSHTLLHAIQYAAPLWESFCMDSDARSSGGMIFVSGYDIAHRIIKAYGWSSESGCAEVYVTVITTRNTATRLTDIGSSMLVISSRVARSTFPGGAIGLRRPWLWGACDLKPTSFVLRGPFGQHTGNKQFFRPSSVTRWNVTATISFRR